MALKLHGKSVTSFFDLIGRNEDGLTYSLGWVMSQCPDLVSRVSSKLRLGGVPEKHEVFLQTRRENAGRTDVEIYSPKIGLVVIEAKRGFNFPSYQQLEQYVLGCSRRDDGVQLR